jgi:hypothetical protein
MEPERPKVDRAVLDFVHGNIFGRADSVIRTHGVCRLSSQLARMVMARYRNRKSTAGRSRREADVAFRCFGRLSHAELQTLMQRR